MIVTTPINEHMARAIISFNHIIVNINLQKYLSKKTIKFFKDIKWLPGDGSRTKFMLIECERYFTCHHLHETWNLWISIFPIFMIVIGNLDNFSMILGKIAEITWTRIHEIELKWKVIPWNAEYYFQVWIFRECEFTDPSLW